MLPYVDLENYELVFSRQRIPLNVRILDKMYPPVVFIVAGTKKKIWDIYDDYPTKESAQYATKSLILSLQRRNVSTLVRCICTYPFRNKFKQCCTIQRVHRST